MNRIEPGEVVAAYKKIGMKPKTGQYYRRETGECCGIGALCLAINPEIISIDALQEKYQVSRDYTCGFIAGFDNDKALYRFNNVNADMQNGIDDGQAAAKAVGLE